MTPSYHILLADDDPDDQEVFCEAVDSIPYEITIDCFSSGNELIDRLKHWDTTLPDILFLDINMPLKNGFYCLKLIRNTAHLRSLCVIIFSTSANEKDIMKSYELGANGYIQKPANFSELKNMLKKVFDTNWNDPCAALDRLNFVMQP
jgi:CheY-like chemotaxis protein